MKILRSLATYVAALVGLVGIAVVLFAFDLPPFHDAVESTNDAYVRGPVTFVSPQLSGYVAQVAVSDYARVEKGDVILRLDDRQYRQELAQAKATLAAAAAALEGAVLDRSTAKARIESASAKLESAKAGLAAANAAWERTQTLRDRAIATGSEADQARAAYEQAKAAVHEAEAALEISRQDFKATRVDRRSKEAALEGARAAVELAEIELRNTTITAPDAGTLGTIGARAGQYVSAGSQIAALVPDNVWVEANFKETQLAGMRLGQSVTFRVDALGDRAFTGKIARFSPAMGSEFSILKPDNATGNFTKVAQRLPVRIAVDGDQPMAENLRPGMSVVADVDVSVAAGTAHASDTGDLPFGSR